MMSEVYHCTPEELGRMDPDVIQMHWQFRDMKNQAINLNAHRNAQNKK